ncbi:hypothetical protein Tco_1279009, partial [Tanacetum coccineum]
DFRTKEKELKAKEAGMKRREQTLHGVVSPPPLQDVVPSPQPPPPLPMYEAPFPSKRSAPPMQVVPPPHV